MDFALKVVNRPNAICRLQLWDIAGSFSLSLYLSAPTRFFSLTHTLTHSYFCSGQERFGQMTRVYYKDAVGAFVVFDVTRKDSFDAVMKWKLDLDRKVHLSDGKTPIPCVLLANKVIERRLSSLHCVCVCV